MKNIFFVSELFYPNQTSTAYIMTEIAKKFEKEGQDVKVITSNLQYDSNISNDEKLEGIDFFVIKTFKGNKNSIFSRIINAFYNSFALAYKVFFKSKKGDIVFAVTNPLFLVILLAIIKKIKNIDYILLVHDVFPENTIPAGINTKEKFIYKILLKVYNWAYQAPSKLIVLGEDMKQLIINKGVVSNKIKTTPNWFDSELENAGIFSKTGEYGKITIGFAGNIGRVQCLEGFIKIFNEIKNPNIELVIIGEGANYNLCRNEAKADNIIFLGAKPRYEQMNFLRNFDIGLITLSEGMYGLGVPSKTYNLLAMGKPLLYIGDKNSEIDMLNNKHNVGWTFSWNEQSKIIEFLENITLEKIKSYNTKNRELAKQKYSKNSVLCEISNFVLDK